MQGVPDIDPKANYARFARKDGLSHVCGLVIQAEFEQPRLWLQFAQVGAEPAQAKACVDVAGIDGGKQDGGYVVCRPALC